MPIKRVSTYTRSQAKASPGSIFVFGDNLKRAGKGGQAEELRGEPNAVGIITKAEPSREDYAYLADDLHGNACAKAWEADFGRLTEHLKRGGTIVWPADGIGTGLALMKSKAPMLWDELCLRTRELFTLAEQDKELILIGAGGRDYADPIQVELAFSRIRQKFTIAETIEGGAAGADTICGLQADRMGILRRIVAADWNGFAKAGNRNGAGPARNRQMADMLLARREQTGCRIGLLALPGGRGTDNMISTAEELGIKVMPIAQRDGHESGVAAALRACKDSVDRNLTRGDLTKSIVSAYATDGLSNLRWEGDAEAAMKAATLACAMATRNPNRLPKPEYLTRDILIAYSCSLIDTRRAPKPAAAPQEEPAI